MCTAKRITITLNPKQAGDAQILAALDALGGEAPSVLKLLILGGINANPSLGGTLSTAMAISTAAKKVKGKGYPTDAVDKVKETQSPTPVVPAIVAAPVIPALPRVQKEVRITEESGSVSSVTPFNTGSPADDYSNF